MKYKQGDFVRIIESRERNGMPQAIITYLGMDAIVAYANAETKIYTIAIDGVPGRQPVLFNVAERMIEPEVNEAMLKAAAAIINEAEGSLPMGGGFRFDDDLASKVYRAMRAARFKREA